MYVNRIHHQNHKYPRTTHTDFWIFWCVDASSDPQNTYTNNTGGVQARQIPPNYCFVERISKKYLWVGSISSGAHATNHGASERWADTGRPSNSHKYHHFGLGESTQTRYTVDQPSSKKTLLFRTIQSTKTLRKPSPQSHSKDSCPNTRPKSTHTNSSTPN
jgi:hypothetical protein